MTAEIGQFHKQAALHIMHNVKVITTCTPRYLVFHNYTQYCILQSATQQ